MEQMRSTETMLDQDGGNVMKIKKSRFWIGVIFVLVVIFLVGTLSGVLSAKHEREKIEEKYENARTKRDNGRFSCFPTSTNICVIDLIAMFVNS